MECIIKCWNIRGWILNAKSFCKSVILKIKSNQNNNNKIGGLRLKFNKQSK